MSPSAPSSGRSGPRPCSSRWLCSWSGTVGGTTSTCEHDDRLGTAWTGHPHQDAAGDELEDDGDGDGLRGEEPDQDEDLRGCRLDRVAAADEYADEGSGQRDE